MHASRTGATNATPGSSILRRTLLAPCLLLSLIACQNTSRSSATVERITKRAYGTTQGGQAVEEITLTNAKGHRAKLITYGATLTELHMPDREGQVEDIVLGFDNLTQYETVSPYFGCTTGRVANRIANGTFTLEGKTYQLATNNAPHHLHGGDRGLDNVVWGCRTLRGGNCLRGPLPIHEP